MEVMKTLSILFFGLFLFSSCSSLNDLSSAQRGPASVGTGKSCQDLAANIVGAQNGLTAKQAQRLSDLDTQWVDEIPELRELVELNRSPRLKQRSRQIISLLRLSYPGEGVQAWAKRYRNLFKECS